VLDSEASLFVTNIVDGATRMSDLLSDLLAYTDVIVRPEVPPERVDLNAILDNVKQNLKTAIDESNAVISSDYLPIVSAHPTDFVSLFQNLLANAIKYRNDSDPKIHISVERVDGEFRLAISDNGIGIDSTYHRQIFEPFKRLAGRDIPGTSLGLAICQRVVSRYSGRIWVESVEGQGATFVVALPAHGSLAARTSHPG
jgi:signal transduction histidine kinase